MTGRGYRTEGRRRRRTEGRRSGGPARQRGAVSRGKYRFSLPPPSGAARRGPEPGSSRGWNELRIGSNKLTGTGAENRSGHRDKIPERGRHPEQNGQQNNASNSEQQPQAQSRAGAAAPTGSLQHRERHSCSSYLSGGWTSNGANFTTAAAAAPADASPPSPPSQRLT